MIERLIKKNIKLLNPHLVMGYLESNNIYPTFDESIIICNFLIENYTVLLKDNSILLSLQGKIRDNIYSGVSNIIMKLKNTYL